MSFPYEDTHPLEDWIGWEKLQELDRDNLTPQEEVEKSELQKYLVEFVTTSIPKALIKRVCSSPDFVAVCLIQSGVWDLSWQNELSQLRDGRFIMRSWRNTETEITETYCSSLDFDLRQELDNLRREGFNLRRDDNKNPNLETGNEYARQSTIYIAVEDDVEWLGIPRYEGETGVYKNNAANRILLLEDAWHYCLNDLHPKYEGKELPKPERDALAECLTEILTQRRDYPIKLIS